MSGAGSTLTTKLVMTGDNAGIVGAADGGTAALSRLKSAANDAGRAGKGMAGDFTAAQFAIENQTRATEASNLAIAAGGDAKRQHIAYLTGLTEESAPAIASIQALSRAHGEYNATVSSARQLLDAGVIGQAKYAAAVEGAAQKLALMKTLSDTSSKSFLEQQAAAVAIGNAIRGMGLAEEEAGVSTRKLEELSSHSARAFGIGREQVIAFREALMTIPSVIAAFPEVSAAIALTAAVVGIAAAEQSYEASIRQVDVASRAHTQSLSLAQQGYADLADQIAATADISLRSARTFEADLLDNNVSPIAWNALAAAVRGYAIATHVDVPQAEAALAQSLAKPSEMLKKLQADFHDISDAQIQYVEHLEQMRDTNDAQSIVADAVRDHYAALGREIGSVSEIVDRLEKNFSDLYDAIGRGANALPPWFYRLVLAGAAGVVTFGAGAGPAYNMGGKPDGSTWGEDIGGAGAALLGIPIPIGKAAGAYFGGPVGPNGAPVMTPEAATPPQSSSRFLSDGTNAADPGKTGLPSTDIGLINDTLQKFRPYDNQLAELETRLTRLKALAGSDDNTTRAGQALAATEHQIAVVQKERTDAELKLDDATRQRLAHTRELLQRGPEVIAQAQLEARTAQEQDAAFSLSALARQKLNDQLAIEKATLPYTTALVGADGVQRLKLLSIIHQITAAMQAQQQAQHELDTKSDVQSRLLNLSGNIPAVVSDEILALQRKRLDDWKEGALAALHPVELGYDQFAQHIGQIYSHDLAQLMVDDLSRRTDWASGVKRVLDQMSIDTADWAKTSAELTQSAAQMFHDDFVDAIVSSKDPLQGFFDWLKKALAEAIYQQYLASTFQNLAGSLVNGIGGVLGVPGAPQVFDSSLSSLVSAGIHHDGLGSGGFRNPLTTRLDHPANWDGALRFHGGRGPSLAGNERRVIVQDDETIRTAAQEAALHQPLVVQLPASMARGGGEPRIEIHTHDAPGTKSTVKQSKTADGATRVDFFNELVDQVDAAQADKQRKGSSQFGQAIADTHQLERVVR